MRPALCIVVPSEAEKRAIAPSARAPLKQWWRRGALWRAWVVLHNWLAPRWRHDARLATLASSLR